MEILQSCNSLNYRFQFLQEGIQRQMDRNLIPFLIPSLVAVSALPTIHDIVWLAMGKRNNFQCPQEYSKDFSFMNDLNIQAQLNFPRGECYISC
jgi:hypothetical protein